MFCFKELIGTLFTFFTDTTTYSTLTVKQTLLFQHLCLLFVV